MALLTLQCDGGGCVQSSWAPRRPAQREGGMVIPFPRVRPSPDLSPVIRNQAGRRQVPIASRHFACMGDAPPHDHPRIFLAIGREAEVRCPYCNACFRFDPLAAG